MVKKEFLYQTNFNNQEELFKEVTIFLDAKEYVSESFNVALCQREKEFPTGLPTEPAVAIPHTDGTYVKQDVIVCILNQQPIKFHEMGGGESDFVYPRLFFVLAITEGETHLLQLQNLVEKIQDGRFISSLIESKSITEFESTINQYV